MSDKCYAVVEIQKWKSHSEIANKNNHNFRVNPVDVLKPGKAGENEVMAEASDANTKERWLKLVGVLEETKKDFEAGKIKGGQVAFREAFIERAAKSGFSVSEQDAKEMIGLINEDVNLRAYYDNQYLKGSRTNFVKQFEDRLAKHGIKKVRKNGVMEIGVVMKVTGGFEKLPEGFDLDKWKSDSMKWLEDTFGKDNILSAVYHADEFSPHIQASIIPITEDGRLSAKDFLPDWSAYAKAQDTYYETVQQPGIHRGIRGGQPGFEDQRRAHNALVNAGEVRLPEPVAGESVKDYKVRAEEAHRQLGMKAHLEMQEAVRGHALEISQVEDTVDELKGQLKTAKEREKEAREKSKVLVSENKFYREQLQGSGVTSRELKDAAAVAAKMKEEYEGQLKEAKAREEKMMSKIKELQSANNQLTQVNKALGQKVENFSKMLVDGGISPTVVNNNLLINYISYAFEHGYPKTAETKQAMQAAYNFGKNLQERGHVLDHEDGTI